MNDSLSCRYFPQCSGCSAIGRSYADQLEAKRQAVCAQLAAGEIPGFRVQAVKGITPSDKIAHYRNRVRLVARQTDGTSQHPGEPDHAHRFIALGLYREGTHDVVDIPGCPVQTEGINETVEAVRSALTKCRVDAYDEIARRGDLRFVSVREGVRTGQQLVGLITRGNDVPALQPVADVIHRRCEQVVGVVHNVNPSGGNAIFGPTSRVLCGRDYIEEIVHNVSLRLGLTSFFQVNTFVAERAYQQIIAGLVLDPSMTLLDLYSGVGAIGLTAAGQVHSVMAIEESDEAVEFAEAAADANGIRNFFIRRGLVERQLPHVVNELRRGGVVRGRLAVAVNPPRKGLDDRVLDLLLRIGAKRIAYLSCNPATLIRDAGKLVRGGYFLGHVELFDMFPQTDQVELLAIFQRRLPMPGHSRDRRERRLLGRETPGRR